MNSRCARGRVSKRYSARLIRPSPLSQPLMESRIVADFENLRVLTATGSYNPNLLDDLVRDFSVALDESSRTPTVPEAGAASSRRTCKKRRFKKRRAANGASSACGQRSGGVAGHNTGSSSDNSIEDPQLRGCIESVGHSSAAMRCSDSDEVGPRYRLGSGAGGLTLNVPMGHHLTVAGIVESDSVTETVSPCRPLRRRRYFKRMAVDPLPLGTATTSSNLVPGFSGMVRREGVCCRKSMRREHMGRCGGYLSAQPGKRKRSGKDRSDDNSLELDLSDDVQQDSNMEDLDGGCSSSISSDVESKAGFHSNEDRAQDGDDEQSDCYHELEAISLPPLPSSSLLSPPSCATATAIPSAAESAIAGTAACSSDERKLDRLLLSDFEATACQSHFQPPLSTNMIGRDIQSGKRRLKDRGPAYSLSSFLQDRQKWNACSNTATKSTLENSQQQTESRVGDTQVGVAGADNMIQVGEGSLRGGTSKRHRLMPPCGDSLVVGQQQQQQQQQT